MDMKKIIIALVAIAVLVGAFYAFNSYIYHEEQSGSAQYVPGKGELEEGGEANPDIMTLGMNKWIWESALYNDGREIKPKQAKAFTLAFGPDGKFAATTDCNSMGGTYATSSDKRIEFSNIFSTEMYCQGSQENDFKAILETTSGYHFTVRGRLILDLKYDSGSATFW